MAVASSGGVPDGSLQIRDGAIVVGSAALDGSGHATVSTSALATGSHELTAFYSGAGIFQPSTSAILRQVVTSAAACGGFDPAATYAVGTTPVSATTADLNSDGHLDVIVANQELEQRQRPARLGRGRLRIGGSIRGRCGAVFGRAGGLRRRHGPGPAVASRDNNNVALLVETATAHSTPPSSSRSDPRRERWSREISTATAFRTSRPRPPRETSVRPARAGSRCVPLRRRTIPSATPRSSLVASDFNGDGKLDIAATNVNSSNVSILLGAGDGTFSAAQNLGGLFQGISIVSADLNLDGFADLAVANNNGDFVSVLLGRRYGTFNPPVTYPSGGHFLYSVTIGDFDGDGKSDLAIANASSNSVSTLRGQRRR